MTSPLVSVIIPVYNDLPIHIQQSMDSIVNQDYRNLEIIIIDDSTDSSTINAINTYLKDSRVLILREEKRLGLPKALNKGLSMAKGKYIARADADDIQALNRISLQIEFLESHPSIGIVASNVNYIDFDANIIKTRIFPETDQDVRRYIHIRNPICNSVVTIRKEVLDRIGYYDVDFLRSEDYELWFRANANGIRIYNLQEVLVNYRVANSVKRDSLNWQNTLKLKKKYFSMNYFFESLFGILSVYLYVMTPKSVQNFIYKKLV